MALTSGCSFPSNPITSRSNGALSAVRPALQPAQSIDQVESLCTSRWGRESPFPVLAVVLVALWSERALEQRRPCCAWFYTSPAVSERGWRGRSLGRGSVQGCLAFRRPSTSLFPQGAAITGYELSIIETELTLEVTKSVGSIDGERQSNSDDPKHKVVIA